MSPTTHAVCYCPDTSSPTLRCAGCSEALARLVEEYHSATARQAFGHISHAGKMMRHLRIRQEAKRLGLLDALRQDLAR